MATVSDDLAAFLAARLDEDEATAKRAAACDKLVRVGSERGLAPGDWSWLADYGEPQPGDIALIDHQVRFDPASVLREVEAKRAVLARLRVALEDPGNIRGGMARRILADLCSAYWDHPDYRAEWKL